MEEDHVILSDPLNSLELVFSSQTSSSPVARPAIIPLSPLSVPLPGQINKTVSGKAANIELEEAEVFVVLTLILDETKMIKDDIRSIKFEVNEIGGRMVNVQVKIEMLN